MHSFPVAAAADDYKWSGLTKAEILSQFWRPETRDESVVLKEACWQGYVPLEVLGEDACLVPFGS